MEYQIRQWLEEALFDLLATKKSLHNISIAELSEHAQIARRTFYRYYHSKEESDYESMGSKCPQSRSLYTGRTAEPTGHDQTEYQ